MSNLTVAGPFPADRSRNGVELRVWERFHCTVPTLCQPVAARGDHDVSWSGSIRDISAGGFGLVLGRRFERGTGLAVEIPDSATCPGYTLLAKVVHATRQADGQWLLGCSLVSELSAEEVQNLVHLVPAEQDHPEESTDLKHAVSETQTETPSEPAIITAQTQVISDVTLVGSLPGSAESTRRARRMFYTGSWPLAPGAILHVWLDREHYPEARLQVNRCYQQGERWIVHFTFLDTSSPDWVRIFDL